MWKQLKKSYTRQFNRFLLRWIVFGPGDAKFARNATDLVDSILYNPKLSLMDFTGTGNRNLLVYNVDEGLTFNVRMYKTNDDFVIRIVDETGANQFAAWELLDPRYALGGLYHGMLYYPTLYKEIKGWEAVLALIENPRGVKKCMPLLKTRLSFDLYRNN